MSSLASCWPVMSYLRWIRDRREIKKEVRDEKKKCFLGCDCQTNTSCGLTCLLSLIQWPWLDPYCSKITFVVPEHYPAFLQPSMASVNTQALIINPLKGQVHGQCYHYQMTCHYFPSSLQQWVAVDVGQFTGTNISSV